MGPYVDSVTSDEAIPAATSVVVIGGGIIGTSAALTLAARGISVVLCEKGYIACEQSSRNWGWCRQAGRDAREMPLIVASLRLWRDMDRLTDSATGFRECGVMYVGESEADEERFSAWLEMARPYDIGARIVRGEEVKALMPGARSAYRCALYVPTDGCAEPQKAAPAIARAAQRKGAVILAHCAVRGIDRGAGRVNARRHGTGTHRMRCGHIGRRSLDQPVLRKLGNSSAPTEGAVLGDAHGARCRWPRYVHLPERLGLPQAARRRVHDRQRHGLHRPVGTGFFAISARISPHHPQGRGGDEASAELAVLARVARAAPLAAGSAQPLRKDTGLGSFTQQNHESRGEGCDDQALPAVSATFPSCKSGPDTSMSRRMWCPTLAPSAQSPV